MLSITLLDLFSIYFIINKIGDFYDSILWRILKICCWTWWNIFTTKKEKSEIKIKRPNSNTIYLKYSIGLNYFSTDDNSIVYIEDISENKQLTKDLNSKKFKLHLCHSVLYIDFDTNYYYTLNEFETFEQYKYCKNYNKLTIGLLNDDKSDIINKWTTDVNLLWMHSYFF